MKISATKILDFDIENRPIAYGGFQWTTADVTAIACGFNVEEIKCWALHDSRNNYDYYMMLAGFREMWDQADIVTGHYIRNHDLPILNGAMIEFGLRPLDAKMSCDTKNDLVKFKDLSKSQEGLSAMLGLEVPKIHMGPNDWRLANRLQMVSFTKRRVIGDVLQHMEMREALIRRGALGPMKVWRP